MNNKKTHTKTVTTNTMIMTQRRIVFELRKSNHFYK